MKVIDLGISAHQFNKPILTYVQGRYKFRVRLPMTAPVVDYHPFGNDHTDSKLRAAVVFGSWKGGTVQVTGPEATIHRIYLEAGGQ